METVRYFKTEDGKVFPTEAEALAHENKCNAEKKRKQEQLKKEKGRVEKLEVIRGLIEEYNKDYEENYPKLVLTQSIFSSASTKSFFDDWFKL